MTDHLATNMNFQTSSKGLDYAPSNPTAALGAGLKAGLGAAEWVSGA